MTLTPEIGHFEKEKNFVNFLEKFSILGMKKIKCQNDGEFPSKILRQNYFENGIN